MIAVVAQLEVKEGKEVEIEAAFKVYIEKVRTEEGTLSYVVHKAEKKPFRFLVYETYRDKDALVYHGSTEHFMNLFTAIAPILAGDPVIETYRIVTTK